MQNFLQKLSHLMIVPVIFNSVACGQTTQSERLQRMKLLVVSADTGDIVNEQQDVVATAAKGSRLWSFDGNRDQFYVIDPTTGREGFISSTHVDVIEPESGNGTVFSEALALADKGVSAWKKGDSKQANVHFEKSLIALRSVLDADHPVTCRVLWWLGQACMESGEYESAEACLTESIAISERMVGADHSAIVGARETLVNVYMGNGRYGKAKDVLRQLLASQIRSNGEQHAATATILAAIGYSHERLYQYSEAAKYYERGWKIHRDLLGGTHEQTVAIAARLGMAYHFIDDMKAISHLEQCSKEVEKEYGVSDARLAAVLTSLGFAYRNINGAKAQQAFQRCLEICRENDLDITAALHHLGDLYVDLGQTAKAEEVHLELLAARLKAFGEDHNNTLASFCALGQLYQKLGDYAKAESYFQRTLRGARRIGDIHDSTHDLGSLYSDMGRYDEAETLLRNAVDQAKKKNRPAEPELRSLTELFCRKGAYDLAVATQEDLRQIVTRRVRTNLARMSEPLRATSHSKVFASQLDTALSLGLMRKDDRRAAVLSAGWLLNGKGLGHEAVAEAALLGSPEAEPFVLDLRSVRNRIAQISLNNDHTDVEVRKKLAALEVEQRKLNEKLAEFGSGRFSGDGWVPVGTLMSRIPFKTRYVSIARVRLRDFMAAGKQKKWKATHYVAWVVPAIGAADVKIVDLGAAKKIDKEVRKLRRAFRPESLQRILSEGEPALENEYRAVVERLSELVLQPIEEHLDDVEEVILSPDGELWAVPWDALLTSSGDYLIQKYRTHCVLSGRDLIYKSPPRSLIGNPVIFAAPDYDLNIVDMATAATHNRFPLRAVTNMHFSPLNNSAAEAASIKPSIEHYLGEESQVLLGNDAQESAFKELHRPRVLVLSTHGYFDPGTEPVADNEGGTSARADALLRCGLALAGANNRLRVREDEEDGILTGLEIVGTDLRGTELVVLSACETAIGEVQNGEGVAGLRQAFQLAGAESVVSSLWQVEDGETARLMNDFFANLAEGMTKSMALRQAKLARIKARRERHGAAHPFFWAAFTLTGQE